MIGVGINDIYNPKGSWDNWIYYTDDFVGWTEDGASWSTQKLTETPNDYVHRIYLWEDITNGQPYWAWVDAKAAERRWLFLNAGGSFGAQATFDLTNGVVGTITSGTAGIVNRGGGVYRCWINGTGISSGAFYLQMCTGTDGPATEWYSGDGTSGIQLYRFALHNTKPTGL